MRLRVLWYAHGRVFFKVMAFLLATLYFIKENNMVETFCCMSLLSIILPPAINGIAVGIVAKQEVKENNLYDMLYVAGIYFLLLLPVCGFVIFATGKIGDKFPGVYDTFSGYSLYLCLAAAGLLLVDIACAAIDNHKAAKV